MEGRRCRQNGRPLVFAVVLIAAFSLAALLFPGRAAATQCGLPDATLWIDYNDFTFPDWRAFARSGVIAATDAEGEINKHLRAGGAQVVFWDMHLVEQVGSIAAPADPGKIEGAAEAVYGAAVAATGCDTPLIAENELFGAQLATPWSPANTRYRANVLAYLQDLSRLGARPFLLLSHDPATRGDTAIWWRQVAAVSDIVRETFLPVRTLAGQEAIPVSVFIRRRLRYEIQLLTAIGISPARLGLMGEFESGSDGRHGLRAARWWELVKLEALAMKQVASELSLGTLWSWGWGVFTKTDVDRDKPATACVWLWARDQELCDAPGRAGPAFDASLEEGQLTLIPAGRQCVWDRGQLPTAAVLALGSPGRAAVGEQLLLDQIVLRSLREEQGQSDPAVPVALARAEQATVDAGFDGDQTRFATGAAQSGLNDAALQLVFANQLRVRALETSRITAHVKPVASAVARALLLSQPERVARLVHVVPLAGTPAPRWLAGSNGYALSGVAPAPLFRLTPNQPAVLHTPEGDYSATAFGASRPVSQVPIAQRARLVDVLRSALTRQARADAVAAAVRRREQRLVRTMLCIGDVLPAGDGGAKLLRAAPFLALGP